METICHNLTREGILESCKLNLPPWSDKSKLLRLGHLTLLYKNLKEVAGGTISVYRFLLGIASTYQDFKTGVLLSEKPP